MNDAPVPAVSLSHDSWRQVLGEVCDRIGSVNRPALLCICGKPGSGKTTLAKIIRKQGLPGIPPRRICVIDDGVLSVPVLWFFRKRVKFHSRDCDNLKPFQPWLRGRQLVIYVGATPQRRLDRCDVVLRIRCPDEERLRRLIRRNTDGEKRFRNTEHVSDAVEIMADHVFDLPAPGTEPAPGARNADAPPARA
jgi:broad-specificity NMP kinase